jgi:hypothetical protein
MFGAALQHFPVKIPAKWEADESLDRRQCAVVLTVPVHYAL